MQRQLFQITLVVRDYDEAISFYTQKLGFELLEDTPLSETKRWVRVAPLMNQGACLLLAKAMNDEQRSRVGNQTGGRVFLFLETNNFNHDYQTFIDRGVVVVRTPSIEPYGKVAVIADCYGNLIDLIQPHTNKT